MEDESQKRHEYGDEPSLQAGTLDGILNSIWELGQRADEEPGLALRLLSLSEHGLDLVPSSGRAMQRLQLHLAAGSSMLDLLETSHPKADLERGLQHCLQAGEIWSRVGEDPLPMMPDTGALLIGILVRYLPHMPEEHASNIEDLIDALSEDLGVVLGGNAGIRQAGLAQFSLAQLLASGAHAVSEMELKIEALHSAGELAQQAALWLRQGGASDLANQATTFAMDLQQREKHVPLDERGMQMTGTWQCPSCGTTNPQGLEACYRCGAGVGQGS